MVQLLTPTDTERHNTQFSSSQTEGETDGPITVMLIADHTV